MTWRVASSQGIRLPLCQILEVVWIGIVVEMLLKPRRARIQQGTAIRRSMSLGFVYKQEYLGY
jgi:hypothetical protein